MAFTGTNDTVPWVVWYEQKQQRSSDCCNNELVFAAKATRNAYGGRSVPVDGSRDQRDRACICAT